MPADALDILVARASSGLVLTSKASQNILSLASAQLVQHLLGYGTFSVADFTPALTSTRAPKSNAGIRKLSNLLQGWF